MNIQKLFTCFVFIFVSLYIFWQHFAPNWLNNILVVETILVFSWIIASHIVEIVNIKRIEPYKKLVLITGCDSGFGYELAKRLDDYGFHVFAGVLNLRGDGAQKLKETSSNRLRVFKLDITEREDVEYVMAQIKQSQTSLWAIVNNAGIGISCPFDWGNDVDEYKKVFEVNVFGIIRVTKNCIPLLRQSNGRIINVSSLAARLTVPQMSHYCMSKSSVRVFTDAIRREPLNSKMKIITIEPTIYKTPIVNFDIIKETRERVFSETPEEIKLFYGQQFFNSIKKSGKIINARARNNVNEVIDAMEDAVTLVNPKITYWCCSWFDSIGLQILTHLPDVIIDLFIKYEHKKFCQF